MAQKQSIKAIEEDFNGLDYKASDLRKNLSFFRKADNASYSIADGLVKRVGFENRSQAGFLMGVQTYTYADRTTGETKEELLGFGCHAFRQKKSSFSFYYPANPLRGCFAYFEEDRLGKRQFIVKDGTTFDTIFTYVLTDTDNSSGNTIYALCIALQTAGFTVTFPTDTLVVQTLASGGVGTDTTITFSYGTPNIAQFYTALNYATGLLEHVYIDNKPSGTSVKLRRKYGWTYQAGDVWGKGSSYIGDIEGLEITGSGKLADPTVVPFSYWEGIPWSYYQGESKGDNTSVTQTYLAGIFEESIRASYAVGQAPFYKDSSGGLYSKYPAIQGVNANNKFYFCFPWDTRGSNSDSDISERSTAGKPFCYDARYIYRAGIFSPIPEKVYTVPSDVDGKWKYFITISYLDNNGIEWESNPSEAVANNTGPTGGGTQVGYLNGVDRDIEWQQGFGYFDTRSGLVRTGAAPSLTLEVSGSTAGTGIPNVAVGDQIYWVADNASTAIAPEPIKRTITAVNFATAPYTITMDAVLPYTANIGEAFSTGLFFNVYRTKEYGNIYYKIKKLSIIGGATTGVAYYITDQISDSDLEIEYVEPLSGEEHDIPPAGRIITTHQGNLIVGGASGEPNTLHWSGVDGIEYFPRAFNSVDIPSTVKGAITAAFSDSDDRLAIFKEKGYYELNGDLATKAISLRIAMEGDYGISSQASIQKIKGTIVGVGIKGIVAIANGQLDTSLMQRVNPLIISKQIIGSVTEKINPALALSVNDARNSEYILSIPTLYPLQDRVTEKAHLTLVYNYERDKWTELNNELVQYNFSGGMTIFNEELYAVSYVSPNLVTGKDPDPQFLSLSNNTFIAFQQKETFPLANRLAGQIFKRKKYLDDTALFYNLAGIMNDFGAAIPFNLITSFECLGEPSEFKEFDVIRIWFVPPTILSGTTSISNSILDPLMQGNSVSLKTFSDWNFTSKVSEVTKTLTGYNDTPYIDINLRDKQARSVAIQLLTQDVNPFGITAIEYIYSAPYASEAKKKYGN